MAEALRLADLIRSRHGNDINDEAAAELRRLHAENERLAAALASSCDEQRHELWESGGVAGCERARVAERQRDALLDVLKEVMRLSKSGPVVFAPMIEVHWVANQAVKAVEGEKRCPL